MEAKRRRTGSRSTGHLPSMASSSSGDSGTAASTVDSNLLSNQPQLVMCALRKCKKEFSKAEVVDSMAANRRDTIVAIVGVVQSASQELSSFSPWSAVLKEAVSVLANCCHLSLAACIEMKNPRHRIAQFAARLLESGERTSVELKLTVLRLVANLCEHKESALLIVTGNSQLLDRIMLATIDERNDVSRMALKILRALVMLTPSFAAKVLSCNGGYYLGSLIAREHSAQGSTSTTLDTVLVVLKQLVRLSVKTVGRQLATSECAGALVLQFFASKGEGVWCDVTIALCEGSFEMRERLASQNVVENIVAFSEPTSSMIRLLTVYAVDAWSRALLREKGALDLLIHRLGESTSSEHRAVIVASFRFFVHDTVGMAYLCQSSEYMSAVVRHIEEYLSKYQHICEIVVDPLETDSLRSESPQFARFRQKRLQSGENTRSGSALMLKGNAGTWRHAGSPVVSEGVSSGPASPSPSSSPCWSPSGSPLVGSPGSISPSSSFTNMLGRSFGDSDENLKSPAESGLDVRDPSDAHSPTDDSDTNAARNDPKCLDKQVITEEVFILSWQSHEEGNLPYLITEEVVDVLIRYISDAPSMDLKAARALKRIARSRVSVECLLEMHFHTRVLHSLKLRTCRLTRFARKCVHCNTRADFGAEVLREFATHVDSDFGVAVLKNFLKSESRSEKLKACIAAVHLIRSRERQCRLYADYRPVEYLISALRELLMDEHFEENQTMSAFKDGPSQLYEIVCSLATLVPPSKLVSALSSDNSAFESHINPGGECALRRCSERGSHSDVPMIRFIDSDGELIEAIPRDRLCASSEYFRGMYSNEFSEMSTGRDCFTFVEDDEHCTRDEFRQFLHHVAGCRRRECFDLKCGQDVVAMLQLSDRYICASLNSMLLASNGPALYFLCGRTLPEFVGVSLSTGVGSTDSLRNACVSCLLRYCTQEMATQALRLLIGNTFAIDTFLQQLSDFVINNNDLAR